MKPNAWIAKFGADAIEIGPGTLLARRDGLCGGLGRGLVITSPTGAERIVMPPATTAAATMAAKVFNTRVPPFWLDRNPSQARSCGT